MCNEKAGSWIVTDPDCVQCCRHSPELGSRVFELAQINSFAGHLDGKPFYQVANGYLFLEDYSEKETLDILGFYGYGDLNEFREAYPDVSEVTYDQLLAEMFFETEIQEYCSEEFSSWNESVSYIQKITGLDLSEYKHKEKESLSNLIRKAEDVLCDQMRVPEAAKNGPEISARFADNENGR